MNEVVPLAVGLGLVLGLLATELFGLAASGLIVPGYIALQLHRPKALVTTLVVALITVVVVRLASLQLVVHGRRRSAAMLIVGYLVGFLASEWTGAHGGGDSFAAVGLVVPGLIALWIDRQGAVETLSAVTTVSVLVRLALVVVGAELEP